MTPITPCEQGATGRFDRLIDGAVTIICWLYFTFGFIVFFSWRYLFAFFLPDRATRFQRFNSLFYRGFFRLLQALTPRQRWQIDRHARALHSSVIVCNHVSYLDPLILISLYERHKTVVKTVFFKIPIFGWVLRHAGYFPADGGGRYGSMMIDQVEGMEEFLGGGGNFFIFPEGTRSRDGSLGTLNRGALKIARLCRAPIQVVRLSNTGRLFIPGRFLFNTRQPTLIQLDLVASLDAGTVAGLSLAQLESRIEAALRSPDGAERSGNGLAGASRDDSTVKP